MPGGAAAMAAMTRTWAYGERGEVVVEPDADPQVTPDRNLCSRCGAEVGNVEGDETLCWDQFLLWAERGMPKIGHSADVLRTVRGR